MRCLGLRWHGWCLQLADRASERCIVEPRLAEATAKKVGVRYTFNCVLWFRKFVHLLSASCVGFGVPSMGIRKYLLQFARMGSNPVMVAVSEHSRCILTSGIPGPKLSDAKMAHHRFAIK